MFLGLTIIAVFVFAVWCIAINNAIRIRAMEEKIGATRCVLLHPERVGAWCPEGQNDEQRAFKVVTGGRE